jgi:hypothetical protein
MYAEFRYKPSFQKLSPFKTPSKYEIDFDIPRYEFLTIKSFESEIIPV